MISKKLSPFPKQTWVMPRLSKKVVLCAPCVEGVDKLGWPAGLTFSCYGARLGVRVNHPAMMETLLEYLPPHSKPTSAASVEFLYSLRDAGSAKQAANSRIRRFHILYLNTTRIMRTHNLEKAWTHLESVLHFNVAMGAPKKIFVHAGVVGWKGRALVIPGRSLSGKSTLVAALVRAGATYYSDEYAVFDERGRVHPYAKPLSMRTPDGRQRVKVEELIPDYNDHSNSIELKPLPVGAVVTTRFENGARWRAKSATAGQGVLDLLDNTVLAQQRPGEALAAFNLATRGAQVLQGKRGEAEDLVATLLH